jgi:hypothetical protein
LKRRLWLINLLLLAGIASGSWFWWQRGIEAQRRRAAVLNAAANQSGQASAQVASTFRPVQPSDYIEVAQKLLFSKDRNPNVELDPPPPPKPMPALPKAHGVFTLADPPSVILSEKAGSPQRGYRPGEQIGAFRIVEVTTQDVEFEWEGKRVRRKLEDLTDKNAPPPAAPAAASAPAAVAPPAQTTTVISGAAKPPERNSVTRRPRAR